MAKRLMVRREKQLAYLLIIMVLLTSLGTGCARNRVPARLQVERFWPRLIAVGPSGNVYIVDRKYATKDGEQYAGPDTILKFTPDGTLFSSINPPGRLVDDIAVGWDDNIYVLHDRRQIIKLSSDGKLLKIVHTFFKKTPRIESIDSKKAFPSGLAADTKGNTYVMLGAYRYNHYILRLSPSGRITAKWRIARPPAGPDVGTNGIAADGAGNIYVLELFKPETFTTVERFTDDGVHRLLWRTQPKINGDRFYSALGLAVNERGRIFLLSSPVVEFNSQGKFVKQFGSEKLFASKISRPNDIAVGGNRLYVLHIGERKVYKFSLSGELLDVW